MPKVWGGLGTILGTLIAKQKGFSQEAYERMQRQRSGKPGRQALISGFTEAYGEVGGQKAEASRARRKAMGQLDLSLLSPGMLQLILGAQRGRRRRSRRGAGISMLGASAVGQKTLLGE